MVGDIGQRDTDSGKVFKIKSIMKIMTWSPQNGDQLVIVPSDYQDTEDKGPSFLLRSLSRAKAKCFFILA